jgi:hypothetical protein
MRLIKVCVLEITKNVKTFFINLGKSKIFTISLNKILSINGYYLCKDQKTMESIKL